MANVSVDKDKCVGDRICASMHPDIFDMDSDNKAFVKEGMEELEGDDLERAKEAADACPVDAIIIE